MSQVRSELFSYRLSGASKDFLFGLLLSKFQFAGNHKEPIFVLFPVLGIRISKFASATRKVGGEVLNENELYQLWKDAPEEVKPDVEGQLFVAVRKHAAAVVWAKLREDNRELAHEIASAAIHRLREFEQRSQFSTWAQGIALNKINSELRRRIRHRKLLDEFAKFGENLPPDEDFPLRITLETFIAKSSPEELALAEGLCAGMDQNELALKLGITVKAADSRRRRFRQKVVSEIFVGDDG